ncbi:TonB family protein [Trichloromonas sp.]|uniref:energy transducer TonB n=1 Tax=Trichloromonas sp. TaxID=3069249 RepID=UPI002A4D601F|nr:TonB family protein [Trichloromonas sp.]
MKHSPLLAAILLSLGIHGLLLILPNDTENQRPTPAKTTEVGLIYIAQPVAALSQPAPAVPSVPETPTPARTQAHTQKKPVTTKTITKSPPRRPVPPKKESVPDIPTALQEPFAPAPSSLPAPSSETVRAKGDSVPTTSPSIATTPVTPLDSVHGHGTSPTASAASPEATLRPPRYRYNPRPEYPALAKRRRWQGEVLVRVRVDVRGEVCNVRLESSSGHDILDQAALKAVRLWKFHPAHDGERHIPQEVCLPIRFELSNR